MSSLRTGAGKPSPSQAAEPNHWLPALVRDHRSYVTVAIGCTGGQHRSVFLVEQLAHRYSAAWVTLHRHRELDAKSFA